MNPLTVLGRSPATSPGVLVRLALILAVVVPAALVTSPATAETGRHATQVGTYDYLLSPDYDGLVVARQAAEGLTLGLGTFDRLDGELVLVGGRLYRVGIDGSPRLVTDDRTTPFFEGVRFAATTSVPVPPGTACSDLGPLVTGAARTTTGMVAVRVRGTFSDLVTRSVAAQPKPYPALAQAIAGQIVFPLGQRRGVLVGFWTGPDLLGVGAPGLHLHGVTSDRTAGGHVLSCVAGSDVQLSVEALDGVTVSGLARAAS